MKSLGYVLAGLGALMTLSSLRLCLFVYDLSSSHNVSKAAGGLAVSIGLLAAGLVLVRRKKANGKNSES